MHFGIHECVSFATLIYHAIIDYLCLLCSTDNISYSSLHNIAILFVLFPIATDAVDLKCESSIGNVFVRVLECEAKFELVDIQCSINCTTLANCKLAIFKILSYCHSRTTIPRNIMSSLPRTVMSA